MKKDIIILTKSSKHSGFCVAGIDTANGEWIRLISGDAWTEHAVPGEHMICEDGQVVNIYDIVEIDVCDPVATGVQPENCRYDETIQWKKKGRSNLEQVIRLHGYDNPKFVFGNTEKKLEQQNIYLAETSLLLLRVCNPQYIVKTFWDNRAVQLNFSYHNFEYKYFNVTQIDLKKYYLAQEDGRYPSGSQSFVFSLTDRYEKDGNYYKVVAQELV